ncbi:hypothetical protein B4135_1277 [Caldibacillus debilis]|uniref:Uncharacterized protein n=1 Tax=Caldibacillus debilis TaxID=301148 RepID=A0A150MD01_9BACI|nr:hypothetical protein B4135_1277 [Caldibacillus debilis]
MKMMRGPGPLPAEEDRSQQCRHGGRGRTEGYALLRRLNMEKRLSADLSPIRSKRRPPPVGHEENCPY